jgi:uncharacterized protein (DUF1778 family)
METERAVRDHLVAFRVTADEHELLSRYASNDEQTITGILRRVVAEAVKGFGSSKRDTETARKEQRQ